MKKFNIEVIIDGKKLKIPVIEVAMVKKEYRIACDKERCKNQLVHKEIKYCKNFECDYD